MKYLQTYETLYFDLKKALNDALIRFFKEIYSNEPNLKITTYSNNDTYEFEISIQNENQKILWCDVTIKNVGKNDYLFTNIELEFHIYNNRMPNVTYFFKDLISDDIGHVSINNESFLKVYIEKDKIKELIKELTKDNFELFVSAKKYNL